MSKESSLKALMLFVAVIASRGIAFAAGPVEVLPSSFGLNAFSSQFSDAPGMKREGAGFMMEAIYSFNPYFGMNLGLDLGLARNRHANYDYAALNGTRLQVSDTEVREFYGKLRPSIRMNPLGDKLGIRPFIGAGLSFQWSMLLHNDPRLQREVSAQPDPASYQQADALKSATFFGEGGVEIGAGSVSLRLLVSRDIPVLAIRAVTLGNANIATQDTRVGVTLVFR